MFRVLFVDDVADARELFVAAVAAYRLPWQVDVAADARAALNLYASARAAGSAHDLVVWDISMPELSGLRAAELARSASGPETKFVVFSGQDDEQSRRAAEEVGALAYFVKGRVPLDEMLQELNRLLQS